MFIKNEKPAADLAVFWCHDPSRHVASGTHNESMVNFMHTCFSLSYEHMSMDTVSHGSPVFRIEPRIVFVCCTRNPGGAFSFRAKRAHNLKPHNLDKLFIPKSSK